jgi:type IV pilus assembly protein PilO
MTYSEDLMNTTQLDDTTYLADAPNHPVIFGVTLSPIVIGGIVAVVGLIAAGYVGFSYVTPKVQANQELQTKVEDIKKQIQDRKNNAVKITEAETKLKEVTSQRETVLSLFANDKKLDTLLLDLNKLVNERQGELQKFTPDLSATGTGTINDSSLGSALNGKIRNKSVDVEMTGGFEQIQSILITVERMDRFLILKDFKTDLVASPVNTGTGNVVVSTAPKLKAKFKLQAIIPLTTTETAAVAAAATAAPAQK